MHVKPLFAHNHGTTVACKHGAFVVDVLEPASERRVADGIDART